MLHNKRHSSWRQRLLLLVAAVLVVAMVAGCGNKNDDTSGGGKVIATYDGGQVTENEFNEYTTLLGLIDQQTAMYMSIPELKEQEVKKYVMYKLYYAEATDEQKKTADTDASSFEKQLKDAVKTQTDLKAQLDKSNLTVAEAKALVKEIVTSSQIIQAKLADFSTKVTEAELKAKYQENPSAFDVATVRHILVKTSDPTTGKTFHTPEEALKLVKEAKDKLDKGGDWKEISKKYSEDDGSKDNGGQYKDAKISGWAPGFKEAASTQKIGVIGEPVESQHGYHVILVEKRSSTPYDKLTKEDKDGANGLRPSIASVKLNDYMTAEQEKIHLKVTLPKEPAASTDGTTNGGATNNATDNSATNSGAATNNAGSGNAATNGAATDNTAK